LDADDDEEILNHEEEGLFECFTGVEDEILGNDPLPSFSNYVQRPPVWASLSWSTFVNGLKTSGKYVQRIQDLQEFYESNNYMDLHKCILDFFIAKEAELGDDGEKKNAPTTLRGWYSTFKAFCKYTQQGNLDSDLPIIATKLDHWERDYVTKKAPVFSKEELGIYLFIYRSGKILMHFFIF
jgi:hypothetical protein